MHQAIPRYAFLCCLAAGAAGAAAAAAAETVPVEQAKQNGFTTCAGQVDKVANHVIGDSEHGALSTWSKRDTDKKMFNSMAVSKYSDGHSVGVISTSQSVAGGCDSSYTTVFHWDKSCSAMRETTFKEWKYYTEVGGLTVLENESGSVNKILMPAGEGCVTVTTEVVYD